MQRPEFDNLMDGKPAKFAEMLNFPDNGTGLMGLLANAKGPNASKEAIEKAREEIAKVEVEIPQQVRYEMNAFINKQRQLGTKERTIRRMVQRLYNITVV